MELERAERGSSTMLRKAEGVHGGREDGGREVVVADEDLSNFAKSEVPVCGATQPQPNKCKQLATFRQSSCRIPDHDPIHHLPHLNHNPSHLDYYQLGVWLLLHLSILSLPCLHGAQLSATTLS